jgi:hypothetical protein
LPRGTRSEPTKKQGDPTTARLSLSERIGLLAIKASEVGPFLAMRARVSAWSPSCSSAARSGYVRHKPETTVLHLVVREHLETFLAAVRQERGKALPRYVEEELRRYLRCGILAHGYSSTD